MWIIRKEAKTLPSKLCSLLIGYHLGQASYHERLCWQLLNGVLAIAEPALLQRDLVRS